MLGIRLHVYQNYKNFQELNWVILSLNIRLHAGLWSHRQSKQFSMAAAGAKNFWWWSRSQKFGTGFKAL